jgi:hypothetical protein
MTHTNTTADSVSVLPCPCCKGKATFTYFGMTGQVQCDACRLTIQRDNLVLVGARRDTVEAWNKRAAIQPAGDYTEINNAEFAAQYAPVCTPVQAAPDAVQYEAVGFFLREGLAYVQTSSDDPRGVKFYRPVAPAVQAAPVEQDALAKIERAMQPNPEIEALKAKYAPEVKQDASALPPLPKPYEFAVLGGSTGFFDADQMTAYVLADRAARQPSAASIGDDAGQAAIAIKGIARVVADDKSGTLGLLLDDNIATIKRYIAARPPVAAPTEAAPDSARDAKMAPIGTPEGFREYGKIYSRGYAAGEKAGKKSRATPESAEPSAEPSADAMRLDWLDQQGYAYGFEDMHEGNRWGIEGPFANLRKAIDAARLATSSAAKGAGDDN